MQQDYSQDIAIFDVDTRTFDETTGALMLMPRMAPIASGLSRLFAWSKEQACLELLTTCLTEPPAQIDGPLPVSVVTHEPMGDVASALSSRQVWLHRPCLSCASENIACRTFDVFHSNPNAGQLVVGSGIKQWLVVGSSLEYCLKSTAMGLRALGCDVLVLEDLVRPARKSTPEGFAATLDELMACDVRLGTLDSFLASMAGESMSR